MPATRDCAAADVGRLLAVFDLHQRTAKFAALVAMVIVNFNLRSVATVLFIEDAVPYFTSYYQSKFHRVTISFKLMSGFPS
jgi:hypothetical protein